MDSKVVAHSQPPHTLIKGVFYIIRFREFPTFDGDYPVCILNAGNGNFIVSVLLTMLRNSMGISLYRRESCLEKLSGGLFGENRVVKFLLRSENKSFSVCSISKFIRT